MKKQVVASAANPAVKVLHMGDSITVGQYIETPLRWTSLLEARLREDFGNLPVDLTVLNRGVSGEQTRMALERFPEAVQSEEPNVLTLNYGLNDCNCWQTDRGVPRVSEDAFRANLAEMVERARVFGAEEIILLTNHRTLRRGTMTSGDVYEDASARYCELIREVARGGAGVALCDIRRGFERYTDEELEALLLPHPDHLHLSPEGNRVYAELLWPDLKAAVAAVAARRGLAIRAA